MASFFKAIVWTGTGGGGRLINVGFQPDLVVIKANAALATPRLFLPGNSSSSLTAYCQLGDQNGLWVGPSGSNSIAANASGFVVESDYNGNGSLYVALCWVSTPSYCGLTTYTGNATNRLINHSLGVQPEMVFNQPIFNGNGNAPATLISQPWLKGSLGMVNIQDFNAAANNKFITTNNATLYNSIRVSPTQYSLGTGTLNSNNWPGYFYTWASVAGACKMGLYTGDGTTNGPAIDLGFTPTAIIVNRCDATASGALPYWFVGDMTGSSPWTKFFLTPDNVVWRTDANGIIVSGTTVRMPVSINVTGVIYSYMAFGDGVIAGGGGSTRGVGWSGVSRLWPTYKTVATQANVGGLSVPGVVAP